MDFEQLKQQEHADVMQTYGRFDVALDHGQGATLFDTDGKAYIDLTSGIGVNSLGHNHERLVQAVQKQAGRLMQGSNLFYTKPMIEAAHLLKEKTGCSNVFFANSGAEANEALIKIARKYSQDKYGPGRTRILTLSNSFHGRTIATLEATGQDKFHQSFYPFTGGFGYIPANDLKAAKGAMTDDVCAVLFEPIQGESGVRPLDKAFVKGLEALCKEKDILLMADEVQTGAGRTGTFYAYEQFGIQPDLVSTAKGLGGGLPIGAALSWEKTKDVLHAGDHGTTFGGNPMSCTAAVTVLNTIDDAFLKDVKEKGEYFMEGLRQLNFGQVRGMGLMIGIEVGKERVAPMLAKLRQNGVLALSAGGHTIRLLPPLVITKEEIDKALAAFKESI
jgi:acetylornithine/N-succinyldiaminopimelate aminotransferase